MAQFDVVVVGLGPGGEVAAGRLLKAGRSVAVVEERLIGGECGYYGCIPSKTMLRGPDAQAAAGRAAGPKRPAMDWAELLEYRDFMIRHLDDSKQVSEYQEAGATVLKASGRLAGPGRVEAGGELLEADHVVIATGSEPIRPPIEGLDEVEVWTNREATTASKIPERVVVAGGGAVGIELGQFFRRMGAQVTIVEVADRLAGREEPRLCELARQAVEADGIVVRTGSGLKRARHVGGAALLTLEDGEEVEADVVVLATGRRPRSGELGLESAGIATDSHGAIAVDERCRAGERAFAVGDVTGIAMFTHVAKYQGRVVADNILGQARVATYEGIPRVVFSDPELAAVGLTSEQAREAGIDVVSCEVDLPALLSRPWTYERDPRGHLGIVADRARKVLVGAWAVAPLAGEWIHQAALAVRAGVPVSLLLDQVAQFPTYTEGYLEALERLELA